MARKKKVGRPIGSTNKTGAKKNAWHPSENKSEVAKNRPRDERGFFLGKRQVRFDINYKPEVQEYHLTIISGNGLIDAKEKASGMDVILRHIERRFKSWRANLE